MGMAAGGPRVAAALIPVWGHEDALSAPYAPVGTVGPAVAVVLGGRLTRPVHGHGG
ncbi:hypothetical protein [Nocardiopsis tropica]|uniref:Uncharacterized protein n=1 Tax=Nocardiopsis tropica TaxID=109330 RepID=A0ABU7KIH5_9ACTN|nr:hypothetical protein [Nocardiopsis umidischolae]MEE2049099.1 hypothetical protein [Nocardiopsis umidischolae]